MHRSLHHRSHLLSVAITLLVLLSIATPAVNAAPATRPLPQLEEAAFVPGQLLIRFRAGVTAEEIADFYATYGLAERENLDADLEDSEQGIRLAALPVDISPELIQVLESDPRIRYAEPNYLLHIAKTPDDPDFDKLWGLHNVGQTGGTNGVDVRATAAWDVATGSREIIVAVIDTGIDFNHEDLAANMWVNPKECPGGYGKCTADGEDDDNNGYVDDFYGANTINDSGDIMDDFGHGTHVAGTIGAVGNNGTGVVGINWQVRILGCKFLSASGSGSTANAIKCFNYITELKEKQGQNIVLTNNSWGGGLASDALRDAMDGANAPLHLCAAGNANSSRLAYPAGYDLDNIIAVAATDHDDLYASFSNWGADWVDFAAPGVDIYSTVPTGSCPMCDSSGYRNASGTSMATPHVAGAAALLWSAHGDLSNEQVKGRFMSGVDALADASKSTLTNGRLNLLNALEEDETPPAPVTDLAVAGVLMTQVDLRWTATGDDGLQGTANAYDIRYAATPISEATWEDATPVDGEPKPAPAGTLERMTVTDLQPATTYYFAMKVMDNVGNASELSNIVVFATSAGTIVFEDTMENGQGSWTIEGDESLWHLSQLRANSPTTAWYYGQEESRNYDTGASNRGYLVSPAINLIDADEVMLTFAEWSELQSNEDFDRTRVQVSTDGEIWQTVFESHGTDASWVKQTVSLSPYIERSGVIHLRFWFDTVNDRFNNYEGWFIDDVRVLVAKRTTPGEERPMANLVMRTENIGFGDYGDSSHLRANPTAGAQILVHAVVLNNGQAEANDVQVFFAHVDEAQTGSPTPLGPAQTIATIPAGGSGVAEMIFDSSGQVGEQTILVTVDPSNFIPEVSMTDNRAAKVLAIDPRPAPNLTIESTNIGFDPADADPGDQVTVHATVRNDGDVEAADVQVQFIDATGSGSTPIGPAQTIDLLPAGESATLQVTYDSSGLSGNRDVGVVLDPNNTIAESSESDNSAEKRLTLSAAAAPNLVMLKTNIGFDPANPTAGVPVLLRATVLNDGTAEATDVLVQFIDVTRNGATPIGEQQTIASIPAGGSGVVEVSYETSEKTGDRKIRIVVDPHNFIAEAKESDNSSEETLEVALPPTPNLVIQPGNIGFSPSTPTDGDQVVIYATIVNNGSADAAEVQVQFVDVTDGGALTIGERQQIDAIPAGGSRTVQVNYPTADKAGERTLQVVVDPGNLIVESDESDNVVKKALRVETAARPNLVMDQANIEFNPPAPIDSERVTVHAVVLNQGAAPATNVLVQFIDMTTGVATPIAREQYIERIAMGGSAAVEATLDLNGQSQDRKIQVLVDSNNLIGESNERDNSATKTLIVAAAPAPNLVVHAENIGFGAQPLRVGEPLTISVVIRNDGDSDATDVAVQIADVTNGRPTPIGEEQIIPSIPAGGSGVAAVIYDSSYLLATLQSGNRGTRFSRQIRVTVDPANFIAERNEIDNKDTATLILTPPPAANLVMQSTNIGFAPPLPTAGEAVSVTATILNNGQLDASDVLVQFVDVTDGNLTPVDAKQTIPLIEAGGSATAQVTYATADREGARKLQVLVDPHTVIPESNEGDNSAIQTLTVLPAAAPNLVVQSANIGFSPIDPETGESVNIRATILNSGNADAHDVMVQFVDTTDNDAIPIAANQTISHIPPGGSAVAEVLYATVGETGDRKIQVIADRNNLIVEQNENDNSATATLEVMALPAPNLMIQVSNIGFDPAAANPGDQVTVYATIVNNGTSDATDLLVQFVDATNSSAPLPIGQPQTIEAIPAGGSGMAQIVYDTTGMSGDRKIRVVADPNNFIAETKESDNEATKTLSLVPELAPNLVLDRDNVSFTPSEPSEGTNVRIRALVINDGNAVATNVVVQFLDVTESSAGEIIGQPQVIDTIEVGGSGSATVIYPTSGRVDPSDPEDGGERKIKVVVDPNNFIAESKETDNTVSSKTLTIVAAAGPNLVMLAGNIGFAPAQPVAGDLVTVHAVVLNRGRHDASDIAVQFVDVTGGAHVPLAPLQIIDSIPAGASGTAEVRFESAGLTGERRIEVNVDPNNFIAETHEGDNAAMGLVTVAAPPAPNLMVLAGNVKFTPSDPAQGEAVSVTVTLINGGNAPATDVVVQVLDVTGGGARPVGAERIIDELPAGESTTLGVIYNNTDQPGERLIQVTADPNDGVAESDEGDNQATKTLTISPPKIPNLVIRAGDIAYSPTRIVAGDEVQITATVHNDGNVEVSDVVVHFVDATNGGIEFIGDPQTIDRIPAGGSSDLHVTYDTTDKEGERRIRVTADPNDQIFETDERDNEAVKSLRVASEAEEPPELPNIAIFAGNIRFAPSSPTVGEPVTMTVNVLNQGTMDADDVLIRVLDITDGGSEILGEQTITGTLAVGDGREISMTINTEEREGSREIQVIADPDDAIEESNEEDNQATKTLTVRPADTAQVGSTAAVAGTTAAPATNNLVVTIDEVTVEALGQNDALLTVAASVANAGAVPVAGVLVQFSDGTTLRGLQRLSVLDPGIAAAAQVSFVLPGEMTATAPREIAVTVDPYGAVAEVNEADNEAALAVDVAALLADGLEVAVVR